MTGSRFSSVSINELYKALATSPEGLTEELATERIKAQSAFFKKENHCLTFFFMLIYVYLSVCMTLTNNVTSTNINLRRTLFSFPLSTEICFV